VKRQRPAQGGSAGAGESPGAVSDADVIDMGGDPPRWPWGSARGPAIGIAVAALAAGLLLGFIGGRAGGRCAVQLGHTLQLGIEIMNQSDRTVVLRQIKPALPLGATGWLTVTFDVMVSCPQPLPVQFKVSYLQAGRLATAELDSFPDLGQVRYNNCNINPIGQ
jgi:hypothetical protein